MLKYFRKYFKWKSLYRYLLHCWLKSSEVTGAPVLSLLSTPCAINNSITHVNSLVCELIIYLVFSCSPICCLDWNCHHPSAISANALVFSFESFHNKMAVLDFLEIHIWNRPNHFSVLRKRLCNNDFEIFFNPIQFSIQTIQKAEIRIEKAVAISPSQPSVVVRWLLFSQ